MKDSKKETENNIKEMAKSSMMMKKRAIPMTSTNRLTPVFYLPTSSRNAAINYVQMLEICLTSPREYTCPSTSPSFTGRP
jgi:hypothetical protein